MDDRELALFQSNAVAYRGQFVAAVVADQSGNRPPRGRTGHHRLPPADHDVTLRADHPGLYAPDHVNPRYPTDSERGDVDAAFAAAEVRVDATYQTPGEHNNPMEPHATIAWWDGDQLTLIDSNQGPAGVQTPWPSCSASTAAQVRVVTEHVGGGFGSKGSARPQVVLAAMAARVVARPVEVALTRQQHVLGGRLPHAHRSSRCASARRPDGRLTAIGHDVFEQTSTVKEFAEQTGGRHPPHVRRGQPPDDAPAGRRWTCRRRAGCGRPARPRACSRWSRPWTSWPVACRHRPGRAAGAATSLRSNPTAGKPCQQPQPGRRACARAPGCSGGADRDPARAQRRDGRWLVGTGMAASTYPARASAPRPQASVARSTVATRFRSRRRHRYRGPDRAAAGGGRGAGGAVDVIEVRIGDTRFARRHGRGGIDGHAVVELGGGKCLP